MLVTLNPIGGPGGRTAVREVRSLGRGSLRGCSGCGLAGGIRICCNILAIPGGMSRPFSCGGCSELRVGSGVRCPSGVLTTTMRDARSLYVEICICWVIRGWGGVSLDAACCGTVGISAVLGRWRSPDTACAWGHNSGVYPRICPSIRGSPLRPVHRRPRFPHVCLRRPRAVGVVVSPVRAAHSVVDPYLHVPRWCGLGCSFHCGCGWSRVGFRVPVLSRAVDPARWSWVGAGA